MMTIDEYQDKCLTTTSKISLACPENLLLQGVMGMSGESGEAIDIVKKVMFQGHCLDDETKRHLAIEIGDVLWYAATTAHSIGYNLSEVMEMNVEKLKSRYPEGHFSSDRSIHRKEGDV